MKVAIVLHLYQPPIQDENIFRRIVSECYLPLIKYIKNFRNHKFTLNIPLSLLEQMEAYGYKDWIADLKALYEAERIELTGCAAYHPLLTKIPQQLVEEQISLNEYGLGYYFGSRHGFEGEPSIMIKNIQGFFPPELAVNNELVSTLSDFGYKWFIAEKTALPEAVDKAGSIFGFKGKNVAMICRDRELSNLISFTRTESMGDIYAYLLNKMSDKSPLVVALDAEFFGHHFKEGMSILENLIDKIEELGMHISSVSDVFEAYELSELDGIKESSWGASDEEFSKGDVYPFWINKKNSIQARLWKIQNLLSQSYMTSVQTINTSDFQTLAIWKNEELNSIQDTVLHSEVYKYILLHKYLHSDKFWWASKREILGKILYDKHILEKTLELTIDLNKLFINDDISSKVLSEVEEIRKSLL